MAGLFDDDPPPPPEPPALFQDLPDTPPKHLAAAYRVLARAYRPLTFADLIGQETMVRTLRNAFALNRVAHAFMLTGVRGIGKTTTARIIARCLNCIGPDGTGGPTADPCGVCANCRAILADRHPDVVEMDAASRTGVDDAREIIEATRFRPMQARAKVFIIDEVHMLSKNAFNALLKTLEEPPPHVKFIFATTELRKVPITVLSRCMRFDLRRVSVADLAARFAHVADREAVPVEAAALEMIARAADGSVRDGLSLLDQAIAQRGDEGPVTAAAVADMLGLADRTLIIDLLEAVLTGQIAPALAIADRAYAHGADFPQLVEDLLGLTHTLTRLKTIPELRASPDLPEAERTRGAALADQLSVPELARAWQVLLKGVAEVTTAPDPRAATDMLLIRLAHLADLPDPATLVRQLTEAGSAASPRPGGASPLNPARGATANAIPGATLDTTPDTLPRPRAVVGGAPRALAQPAPLPGPETATPITTPSVTTPVTTPVTTLRELAQAVAASRGYPLLHAHLVHSVHLVRLTPGRLEFRPEPDAPRSLAADLGAFLLAHTGTRWTVVISPEPGDPTLAQQAESADLARRDAASDHALVRAILVAFPGATLVKVEDRSLDAYGLPAEPVTLAGDPPPDFPDFAPDDALPADDMPEPD